MFGLVYSTIHRIMELLTSFKGTVRQIDVAILSFLYSRKPTILRAHVTRYWRKIVQVFWVPEKLYRLSRRLWETQIHNNVPHRVWNRLSVQKSIVKLNQIPINFMYVCPFGGFCFLIQSRLVFVRLILVLFPYDVVAIERRFKSSSLEVRVP